MESHFQAVCEDFTAGNGLLATKCKKAKKMQMLRRFKD